MLKFGSRRSFEPTLITIVCEDCQLNLQYVSPAEPITILLNNIPRPDFEIHYAEVTELYGMSQSDLVKAVDKIVSKCSIMPVEFISLFLRRTFVYYVEGAEVSDINGVVIWVNKEYETSIYGKSTISEIGILNLIYKIR